MVRNSSWLATMHMDDVLRLTAKTTVARIMERDDFSTRFAEGSPIALSELLYPLLQATDSVEVRADVELGGTDQLFNNLMGRHLQGQAGQDAQVVLTTPLLEGLDGVQKMSKSLGNYIGINEPPGEQFGKLMSIPDALMPRYFQLTTGWLPEQVESTVEDAADRRRCHRSRRSACSAGPSWTSTTVTGRGSRPRPSSTGSSRTTRCRPTSRSGRSRRRSCPPSGSGSWPLIGLATSNKDARRKIEQGAVRLDQEKVTDPEQEVTAAEVDGRMLSVGKRSWAKVRRSAG